tara:strand:- start:94 stop:450 length:357 start_codon:yes stop_codon:yes gene_type:complete
MNKDIKAWIQELKQIQMLNEMYKKQVIELDNYFKYSGAVESSTLKKEIKIINNTKIYSISGSGEDKIINHYYRCSNITLEDISENLGVSVGTIRKVLTKHFENLKIKKDGNNFKNEGK